MKKIVTLAEALNRIVELEKENAKLKEEVEYYKNRKTSGRQKHNAKWMAIYNDFVVCYEGGMTMVEFALVSSTAIRLPSAVVFSATPAMGQSLSTTFSRVFLGDAIELE
mgnify:CR=1 FL=1